MIFFRVFIFRFFGYPQIMLQMINKKNLKLIHKSLLMYKTFLDE